MQFRILISGLVSAIAACAVAAPAQAPSLVALNRIEPGQWALRELGGTDKTLLCVADPRALIHLRHPGAQCSRFVVEDKPRSATVHYTCPGAGHGRTDVAVESPRLIRLRTQGIADGAPFDAEYEGRRIGTCG